MRRKHAADEQVCTSYRSRDLLPNQVKESIVVISFLFEEMFPSSSVCLFDRQNRSDGLTISSQEGFFFFFPFSFLSEKSVIDFDHSIRDSAFGIRASFYPTHHPGTHLDRAT